MPETKVTDGQGAAQRMASALHALSQPIMALQCRLELGSMLATADAYREAVMGGMGECERIMTCFSTMRDMVRHELEQERDPGETGQHNGMTAVEAG